MKQLTKLETVIPGLHATRPEPLPFAPSIEVRAFLLEREPGNILVYSTGELDRDAAAIEDLGGLARRYLNHRHEAMFGPAELDAPLFVHECERDTVEREMHVRGTFSRRHLLDDDFEVIPTPGHTSGTTAFLWDGGGHRALFTGDTIYLSDGAWVAAVLEGSSDRAAYLESLELIRELDFDVLVPWAASAGEPYHAVASRAQARRRIDAIIERVRRGEDG
jgi:glyoxylase-like metal-dependent hydrolase (beta-lactamase superfamily II)